MFCKKNKENKTDFNISTPPWRIPGLSAFVRLANEEEWVRPAIESILPWVDEAVCVLQCSTDSTQDILMSINNPKISIFKYPFESWPNGPGHDKQPDDSLHNNAYFYNWNIGLTTREWVIKWDGDMVAMDWLGDTVRDIIKNVQNTVVCINGINLVGDCICMSKDQPFIRENQPRIFQPGHDKYYVTGRMTQTLHRPVTTRVLEINQPGYLHFKWAKKSCFQGWPENWKDTGHFSRIARRAEIGEPYTGEIPSVLKNYL